MSQAARDEDPRGALTGRAHLQSKRQPYFVVDGKAKVRRHDANHLTRHSIDADRAAQNSGRTAETTPPQTLAEKNHVRPSDTAFLVRESATENRRDIHRPQTGRLETGARDPFG